MNVQQLFYPVIGSNDPCYYEISPYNDFKPYIRCFWGFQRKREVRKQNLLTELVIPDACSDVIFEYYEEDNRIISYLYGISDEPILPSTRECFPSYTFAIRFYGWALSAFTNDSMRGVSKETNMVEHYFPGLRELIENAIYENQLTSNLVYLSENYLRHHYHNHHVNQHVISAIGDMILSYGREGIDEIAAHNLISKRQLERAFQEYVGISPKKMAGIIRYQFVWQDILNTGLCNMDYMLAKYRYSDQAHMLNDFKKHHGMNWREALNYYIK